MMGISLGKLLFTVAVVVGVWTLFRTLARRGAGKPRVNPAQRAARMAQDTVRSRMGERDGDRGKDHSGDRGGGGGEALDLVRCPSCGAFTPQGSTCQCGWKAPG